MIRTFVDRVRPRRYLGVFMRAPMAAAALTILFSRVAFAQSPWERAAMNLDSPSRAR